MPLISVHTPLCQLYLLLTSSLVLFSSYISNFLISSSASLWRKVLMILVTFSSHWTLPGHCFVFSLESFFAVYQPRLSMNSTAGIQTNEVWFRSWVCFIVPSICVFLILHCLTPALRNISIQCRLSSCVHTYCSCAATLF